MAAFAEEGGGNVRKCERRAVMCMSVLEDRERIVCQREREEREREREFVCGVGFWSSAIG